MLEAVAKEDRRLCYLLLIHSTLEDVNTITNDSQKMTPLHLSCKLGNPIITQLILWVSCENLYVYIPFYSFISMRLVFQHQTLSAKIISLITPYLHTFAYLVATDLCSGGFNGFTEISSIYKAFLPGNKLSI